MDTLQVLGSAMGLGLLAGVRLYATVFTLGLCVRFGWFHLNDGLQELAVLASTPVLIAAGSACFLEFCADKVPWVDSVWDAIHTFIRPIGAVLLSLTALGSFDPTTRVLLALLSGGIAFTGHTSKAATRLAVNASPEPFSNIVLSTLEDAFVPLGVWLTLEHPLVIIVIASVLVVLALWLSHKIFRLLQTGWRRLRGAPV